MVDTIATIITMMSGIAASLVARPAMISAPQTISTTPTNGPIEIGIGDTDIREPGGAENLRKRQLLNALGEEDDKAYKEADQDRPSRCLGCEKRAAPVEGTKSVLG